MDLQTRMNHIIKVLNSSNQELTAKDVVSMYIFEFTTSDILTTGTILNVMYHLDLVKKISYRKGKSIRYRFRRLGNNLIRVT